MRYAGQRKQMIRKYVVEAGITDGRVIDAMTRIPRHRFVDAGLAHQAYSGNSLPIGFGQTISHPTTVAFMSMMLQIRGGERVLEIGTGSGYQAAVLAEMGAKVFTVERIVELAHRAQRLFEELKYYTIAVKTGDGSVGWNEHAPYQRIMVTAAAERIPESLLNQLAEGGRAVIPVGDRRKQTLNIITRHHHQLNVQKKEWRSFVPLLSRKG